MLKEIWVLILAQEQQKDTGFNCTFFNLFKKVRHRYYSLIMQKFIISSSDVKIDRRYVQALGSSLITQLLMNQILKIIKPVHHFLFRKDFEEQNQLSKDFFQDFTELIHTLPRIKKSSLIKIPKLMEFICVINPMETEQYQSDQNPHIRRKNATVYQRPKHAKKYSMEKKNNESNKNFKVVNNSIVRIKQKKHSLQKNLFDSPKKTSQFIRNFQIFKFNDKIRKYSIYNKSKKKTIASMQTKQKNSSIDKDRSPSYDRSLTLANDPIKLKSRTIAVDVRKKETSIVMDGRSRQMTAKSFMSRQSRSTKRVQAIQGEEIEHEREDKTKKKKASKLPIRTNRYSQQKHLDNGKTKGWAIIREYLRKKIAERKLKKLILG